MIWLTADQHFGHKNIISYSGRPFADVEDMTAGLIARHNAVVGIDDIVIHVGDFTLDERLIPSILPQLRGEHRLVCGNHDACHPKHRGHQAAKRRYITWGFSHVAAELRLEGFTIAHMPYVGDHTVTDRYAKWRPVDEGNWLLHGHVHEAWKARGRMINVGVDQWNYGPVSLEEVARLRQESRA